MAAWAGLKGRRTADDLLPPGADIVVIIVRQKGNGVKNEMLRLIHAIGAVVLKIAWLGIAGIEPAQKKVACRQHRKQQRERDGARRRHSRRPSNQPFRKFGFP